MPFLDRYVKTVPLAAELLDVRRNQKLEMVKELKVEKARYRFEVEIGKSPVLSDDELWLELRHKALELQDEWRLKNRQAFANIWSDMVFGVSVFILLYVNPSKETSNKARVRNLKTCANTDGILVPRRILGIIGSIHKPILPSATRRWLK